MLKYTSNPAERTFQYRLDMCAGLEEGCELEDAISNLIGAAHILYGISDYFTSEMVLLLAEKLCLDYINWLRREGDWDLYEEINEEVYKHFTGGATKLNKEEFRNSYLRIQE